MPNSRLDKGNMVRLSLDEIGPFDARVILVTAHSIVLQFSDRLHPAVASMLQAR